MKISMNEKCFTDNEFDDEQTVTVSGIRLDTYLSETYQISRSKASDFIQSDLVRVNSLLQKKSYILNDGDVVSVKFPILQSSEVLPENIPLDIVYEDTDLLVVNKAQGMVVHPAPGNFSGTLVNALMYHIKDLSGINGVLRPGIVHRIDKNTSGLLIVAKNDISHIGLASQIKDHSFDRCYEAVVHGTPREVCGDIRYSIGRSLTDRKKMAPYDENSTLPGVRKAVTHYKVLKSYGKFSHLQFNLETGRTHQIRVHMKAIGHPIVGDDVYCSGNLPDFSLKGQCLHAKAIGFNHPTKNIHMYFESDLPDYFNDVLLRIENMYNK